MRPARSSRRLAALSAAAWLALTGCEPTGRGATAAPEPPRPSAASSAGGAASTSPSAASSSSVAVAQASTSASASASAIASAEPSAPPAGFSPIPSARAGGFPGVAWSTVRAFSLEPLSGGRPTCLQVLADDGALCKTVKGPGVLLTDAQAKRLLALLGARASYGGGAKTFLPQHGFVFYDARGTPVAEVAICLDCENVRGRPRLLPEEAYSHGLRAATVGSLRALCKELGLSRCDAP